MIANILSADRSATGGSAAPSLLSATRRRGLAGGLLIAECLIGGLLLSGWVMTDGGGVCCEIARAEDAAEEGPAALPVDALEEEGEGGIGFPSDRLRERQLDRARRLVDDQRWSDAATLFDDILAADRDAFFRADQQQRTWQSIKSETHRLIGALEKPGREAYELQFRARADRMLEQAVAANDTAGIVAVARRWFHTPAGYRATLLAAIEALEAGQPLAAAVWLDRLESVGAATAFEPTLSIMRAIAWLRAGDRAAAAESLEQARGRGRNVARLGGKDVTLSFPAGGGLAWLTALVDDPKSGAGGRGSNRAGADGAGRDWVMHRGDPARNGVAAASCPLLAPRYRVPLARHPEEARLLDAQRRAHAEQEVAVLPAGTPLAVDGTILVRTTIGLLAVDFETGKRIWLQTGPAAAQHQSAAAVPDAIEVGDADASGSFTSVFEDATSGTLASDGRLVFVVESHPDSLSSRHGGRLPFRPGMQAGGGGLQGGGGSRGGNTLSAYDVADRGSLRWRLPARGLVGDEAGQPAATTAWYLGAPLPVGKQVLVLVEEKGEIRLDVLEAATGRLEWSQPCAEVDEERAIDNRESQARRLAGLSPALSEGVLVCPTGAGAVVAVDLATRTLLWAHEYPQARQAAMAVLPNGIRVPRNGPVGGGFGAEFGARDQRTGRWLDSTPILAGGRVLLTQGESQELLCLDLRQGTTAWRQPRKDRLFVAGVVDGRVIVVGRRGVEALELASGRVVWQRPLAADHGSPSGRGILTPQRLFLPLATPEVLEIDLADGRFVSRASARGHSVPGNLLAYRGEVISQGADSLEVFHQSAALESRIETALKANARDAWATLWRGQLALDRGDIAAGIAAVREAHALQPQRVPATVVASALLFALGRDFDQAAPLWRETVALSGSSAMAVVALRTTVDGFLRGGDLPQAWEAFQVLLSQLDQPASGTGAAWESGAVSESQSASTGLIADEGDPQLAVAPSRWLQGRLAELFAKASPSLRAELDAVAADALETARAAAGKAAGTVLAERAAGLRECIERFGRHERALDARRLLAESLAEASAMGVSGDEGRQVGIEREFVLLDLARVGKPADREQAAAVLATIRRDGGAGVAGPTGRGGTEEAEAWPLGRVVQRRASSIRSGSPRQGDADELRFVRSRLINIPVAGSGQSFLPGLELAFDQHQQSGIIATDGFGRLIGEPFGLKSRSDIARLVPMLQQNGIDEASVVGRVVFVRAGSNVAAVELAPGGGERAAGRNRPLWMLSEASDPDSESRAVGFAMNVGVGRAARPGNIPLGARVLEPRATGESSRQGGARAAAARCTGVAVMVDRTLRLYAPLTGRLLWERQRLPPASDLIGDDDFLCVCPADGRGAVVLAMADGRIVRTLDLPASERRLLSSGRHLLTVESASAASDEPAAAPGRASLVGSGSSRVRIERFDPVDGQRLPLGDYSGDSRVSIAGDGRLAVVEPTGDLSLLDIDTARTLFRTRLSDMPAGLESLHVLSWKDRYLVLVGRAETAEEQRQVERIGGISPLPGMPGRELPQLVTGSLWAVDATSGDMLWPVPATILRHSLQAQGGAQLPVLLFARTIQSAREPDRQRLSVLCLDKRTGQAVYVDDRFNGRSPLRPDMMVLGCGISGDPAGHTIGLAQGRRDEPDLQLEFTGAPTAPRPPFQAAAARAAAPADPLGEIEYWIKKALTIPLPF
jgi:outer membrane protein assembly factor BamB/tetratricopeptide (TPR) repeat protein